MVGEHHNMRICTKGLYTTREVEDHHYTISVLHTHATYLCLWIFKIGYEVYKSNIAMKKQL